MGWGRLQILAFFMLTGVGSTLLIKETKQKTLEDLSNERQDTFLGGSFFAMLTCRES